MNDVKTADFTKKLHAYFRTKVEVVRIMKGESARHPRTVRRYAKNPTEAFVVKNIKKAKEIGFKVLLVVVELLDNWKCKISHREL